MDEKRKAWCEKYKVDIKDGGFKDKYVIPEHVERILTTEPGTKPFFVGFDGKAKTYEELTEEEKKDYQEQCDDVLNDLHKFLNRKKDIGKEPGE